MIAPIGGTMREAERQLVERCRAGDREAFNQVYARHEQQVFRYAYHLLGQREDADDVKQETFVRAYQAMGNFRQNASLQTWLLKICGNLCRDRIKSWERRKVRPATDAESENMRGQADGHDPHLLAERADTAQIIFRALAGLPPAHREIIALYDLEEYSYPEIAQILGCSHASAKLRLFRARRFLKERVVSLLQAGEQENVSKT